MATLELIYTKFGVFYWHYPTSTWQPVVLVGGRLIPVAVLA